MVGLAVVCCFFLLLTSELNTAETESKPDTKGFISIDCGLEDSTENYTDTDTGLMYTSESGFIDDGVGTSYKVTSATYNDSSPIPTYLKTVRSFPSGGRNCYTLQPYERGLRYLIRAWFLYGNYDGLNEPPQFDLNLGLSKWKTVKIPLALRTYYAEVITFASNKYIWVCLVNTGSGTPFISSLEMRPLKDGMYPSANTSTLILALRQDLGSSKGRRYPDDPYDRFWHSAALGPDAFVISTDYPVVNLDTDKYNVPPAVMETAITAANNGTSFKLSWAPGPNDKASSFHVLFHYAELQNMEVSRTFSIKLNGDPAYDHPLTPTYLRAHTLYSTSPTSLEKFDFELYSNDGTSPPLMNAWEMYSVMVPPSLVTDIGDVLAIMGIKIYYKVKKNWTGDPCVPDGYTWDGLTCSNNNISGTVKVTELNLSSCGLVGEISDLFSKLKELSVLDLSNNSLTGSIPESLAYLPQIKSINLAGNQLTGSIPPDLRARSENGSLKLSYEGNPHLCIHGSSCAKKNKMIIVFIVMTGLVLLLLSVLLWYWTKRKQGLASGASVGNKKTRGYSRELSKRGMQLPNENRSFTSKELEKITNNYERCIGKGGSGKVYHGNLDNGRQVAVKLLNNGSVNDELEFRNEATHLTNTRHTNLVELVGYCTEDKNLALVCEYMPHGSLDMHLSGKARLTRPLSWIERLQIALGAAKGLEYLHTGCNRRIIHRDVKTQNILLSEKLQAKVADFGLSKTFINNSDSHVSTLRNAGTLGYLDPENSGQLNEKTDVYSFGVVLLELITGQPAILKNMDHMHLSNFVEQRLAKGDTDGIVDARMQREYDFNSIRMVIDLAMNCINKSSSERNTMSEVIQLLNEALKLEAARVRAPGTPSPETPRTSNMHEVDEQNIGDPMVGPSSRKLYKGT